MSNRYTHFNIIFIIVVCELSAAGHKVPSNNFYLDISSSYGYIMPHHTSIEYLLENHIPSFELSMTRPPRNLHAWDQLYRFPLIGAGFNYTNFGNPTVLGNAYAGYAYILVPLIRSANRQFFLNYRFAAGLAYHDKIFHIDKNVQNIAIGSHLNMYFNVNLNARYKLFRNTELSHGIGMSHFSNGKVKSPNLGLNVIAVHTGIHYFFNKGYQYPEEIELPEFEYSGLVYNFSFGIGTTTISRYYLGNFFMSSFSANAMRPINHKRMLGLGLDLFYDRSLEEKRRLDGEVSTSTVQLFRPGAYFAHDVFFNRLKVTMQFGYYLYSSYEEKFSLYQRYGIRYFVSRNLFFNTSLKTHFSKADYIEWGIGFSLNNMLYD